MLLNLTNHPSQRWPEEQRRAAKARWGSVTDYPFPTVDPEATTAQVAELARRTVEQVCALRPEAVLCQGEMSLTLALVTLLQNRDIQVYVTCSRRESRECVRDGVVVKTACFRFAGFREYPRCLIQPLSTAQTS